MILGHNPVGHCFVLRDLVLIQLFLISHTSLTEWMLQANVFVKTCLEAIRYTLIYQYVEFPNMWYFYPTEGKSLNF